MSVYPPPLENTPIFNSQEFLIPLNATITVAEADAKYLARQDIAISVAQTTSFSDNITIGNSLLDYIPAQGLQIKPTVNSEAVFLRVLDGTGATKQRIECNAFNTHLYDQTRITDSSSVTNYSAIQQTGVSLDIYNTRDAGTINFRTETSTAVVTTPLSLSSTSIAITPSTATTGLNGLVCNSAFFGRNDLGPSIFSGDLLYTRHPIGWIVTATKQIAIPTSNVPVDVISFGTPITQFNTLSNGMWKIGCICNNIVAQGVITFIEMSYGSSNPTGGLALNASISQLTHRVSAGLSDFSLSYPEMILRTNGNGATSLTVFLTTTFSSLQPTITFNIFAIKLA